MIEKHLISALVGSRDHFDALASRGIEEELSPFGKIIFQSATKYYANDPSAQSVDTELLLGYVKESYPKQVETLRPVLEDLPDTSGANVVELWLEGKRSVIRRKLAAAAANAAEGDEEITRLMDEYNFYKTYDTRDKPKTYNMMSAVEIVQEEAALGRVPFYPAVINQAIGGGIPIPSNVGVMALPNEGKTQLMINAVARMCHAGYKVLYFANEESPKILLLRFISRMADMDIEDVRKRPQEAFDKAVRYGYEHLTIQQLAPGTIGEIISWTDKIRPTVVVVDQIRNIHVKGTEGLTQVLERGMQALRNLGNRYQCVTIGVTQAGESARDKPVLDMGDVEYSNVGFAATLDLHIGIGSDEDLRNKWQRVLTICKNKITAVHSAYTVSVNPLRSKVRSLDGQ